MKTYKSEDNIETLGQKFKDLFQEFVKSIELPFSDESYDETSELEWQSRDGFRAFDSTRGGYDRIVIIRQSYLTGSGEIMGLVCQDKIEKFQQDSFDSIKKEYPDMTGDQIYDEIQNNESEYDDVAYRVRILYKGNNEVQIDAGFDYDAPYFLWTNESDFEADIKFKNFSDLKRKLKSIVKKIEKAQYSTKIKKVG